MVASVQRCPLYPIQWTKFLVSMPCILHLFTFQLVCFLNSKMQGKWFYMTLNFFFFFSFIFMNFEFRDTLQFLPESLWSTCSKGEESIPRQEIWVPRGHLLYRCKESQGSPMERDASQFSAVPAIPVEVTDPWMMLRHGTSHQVTFTLAAMSLQTPEGS